VLKTSFDKTLPALNSHHLESQTNREHSKMTEQDKLSAPESVSLGEALWFWLKLGLISFGGPAGQIAIMHQELVQRRRWISEKRFLHALNYCMVLPGPEAQQLATYIGWLMHRSWGGLIAGGLFVLPSLFILIGLSWVYIAFGSSTLVAGLFYGIKPAVTAIVVQAVCRIGGRALKHGLLWAIAACAFIAIFAFELPFPVIILGAALIGYVASHIAPTQFSASAAHGKAQASYGTALIDDNSPTPEHARFRWSGLFLVLGAGALLWLMPMAALVMGLGWQHTLTQMAWFFTKAALLTFGGAYAVLPYVYQAAVDFYGWVTPLQMIDGLALGETTPGPLIMVVAYVGFIGAYIKQIFGPESLFLAGAAGAFIATWFTFLPSFIFIFGGGPFIETTHNNLKLTAPFTAITAAVVGVILNLALFFAYHVWWPQGFSQAIDWWALVLTLAAATALIRYRGNVVVVLASCALAGLALRQVS
jgi:chromate transporter